MIKRLLKKYKYPPEEAENALETVIHQCEQWTDNDSDNYNSSLNETRKYDFHNETYPPMAADERVEYYTPVSYTHLHRLPHEECFLKLFYQQHNIQRYVRTALPNKGGLHR